MALLLAFAYVKTFTILVPSAMYLSWNLTQNFVFPEMQRGNQLFILAVPAPIVTVSYFVFFVMLLLAKISAIGLGYLIIKTQKQVEIPT